MRAFVWHGKEDVRIDTVPDPRIEQPGDPIVRVTSTAICGSGDHRDGTREVDQRQPSHERGGGRSEADCDAQVPHHTAR